MPVFHAEWSQAVSSNDNEAVLTVSELMARWKCTRKTVLDLIHTDKLHAFKLAERAYRVPMDEVKRVELERKKAA